MSKILVILFSLLAFTSYGQVELPAYSSSDEIVRHMNYTLQYNEKYEQADWVAYKLTKSMLITTMPAERKNNFKADPLVPTKSASTTDYSGSGYDRGHLCPSADFKTNQEFMDETFYMSNMSPMEHDFNAGNWEDLEDHERIWAKENDELYIVTGPILKDEPFDYIGKKNRVAIPKRFYKVVLDYKEPELKAIAFIMPHRGGLDDIGAFAVTVDEVEQVTGFDFFPTIPKDIQEKLESSIDLKKWGLREASSRYVPKNVETTQGKPVSKQANESGKVQPSMDTDKLMLYAIVILGIFLVIGGIVLVIGIKMNRKGK
ncbi:MAG TPA: DNA/RNA endonuclease [Lentisphaeria bacterium]|nr:MAG: hypothetical protein A2X45_14565 [Lentisphaerae bacterium GWF2_50_93]HCE45520.1 DNA/RNA endonuclease [Lentisphaeria bacterium]